MVLKKSLNGFFTFLCFLLQFVSKVYFLIQRTGDMPSEVQLKSYCQGLFTLFSSFLNGCILIFLLICPYFALSPPPPGLKHNPLLELCFMRCDSEVWLPRQSVWTGT